ncbi:hypothetical protein NQ176_g7067 [Zarea fungicola]|uniref:Uncharacterized protein n=1 Tax=Zarea fungicola TaxID=93591 RepID=A0ACC1N2B8_9HYPO|nr:hypothetical protein NQ176_g7067 [Lecanicillium fungicola]
MEITDNDVYCLLYSVNEIPKPITQLERSGEGGEHVVFIVNDGFALRIRADGLDDGSLVREKKLWDILGLLKPESPILPICLGIGIFGSESANYPYGVYQKLGGVSVEASPQSVTHATEVDLAAMLLLLKRTPVDAVRVIGVCDAEPVNLNELRCRADKAWQRLRKGGHAEDLRHDVDIEEALQQPEGVALAAYRPVLLHADLKGEHIFIDANTGHVRGVIDWSDACIGHPSVDIHGLAISIGTTAATRVARIAGYSEDIVARGIFTARCYSIICLDAILDETDDSPEWLVRLQLQKSLEDIHG